MRKILFLFVILLLIASDFVAIGQSKYYRRSEPKFGYGIKAGVNISTQSTTSKDANYDLKNIIRFNVGGYCNYFFNKFLAVQPELLVSGKGVHWKDFYDDRKDILTYIDIPLLIKYQPVRYINIHAGPQIGLRVRAMQKDLETGIKTKINDYYRTTDFGVACGVEANLPNHVNLTVRYVFGITSATTELLYVDPWFNNFLQFSAGFRFSGR
jgi:Outer membrane protein beta-barrel domain